MDYSAYREFEREGWSKRAHLYRDATARVTLQTIPKLIDQARLFPGANVLDAGCGPGFVAANAKLLGAIAAGIDFSERMVGQSKDQFPELNFSVADVEDLPAGDEHLTQS